MKTESYIEKEVKKEVKNNNKRYIGEVAELPATVGYEEGTLVRKGKTVFIKQDGIWESLIEGNTVTREVVKYGVPGGGCGVDEVKRIIKQEGVQEFRSYAELVASGYTGQGPGSKARYLENGVWREAVLGTDEVTWERMLVTTPKNRRVAALGTSIGYFQYMPSTGDESSNSTTKWMPLRSVALGSFIFPRYEDLTDGFRDVTYVCTKGGTTGAVEPVWSHTEGAVIADGTAEFTAVKTNVTTASFAHGAWTFAQALAGQPLDEAFLVGYSGGTFDEVIAYWDRAMAVDPGVVFVSDFWLNIISTATIAGIKTNWNILKTKMDEQLAAGSIIILQTVLPKADIDSSAAWTGYVCGERTKCWKWLNNEMRKYAREHNSVHLLVVDDIYIDPNPAHPVWPENSTTFTSQAGSGQALKFSDGVHPNQNAQWRIAHRLAEILKDICGPVDRFAVSGAMYGISANPYNYGTAGLTYNNATGTVPDLYGVSGSTACAVVASKGAVAGTTRSVQILELVANAANATAYMIESNPITIENPDPNALVQAFAEVTIKSGAQQFRNIQLFMGDNVRTGSLSGPKWCNDVISLEQNMDEISEDISLVIKTPPQKLGARTALRTNIQTIMSGAGTARVEIARRTVLVA